MTHPLSFPVTLLPKTALLLLPPLFLIAAALGQTGTLTPTGLRVEYAENPIGIDARVPRLSWRSTSTERNARQTAYQIQAAASEADLAAGRLLWDSGRVASDQSLFVPYGGPPPVSGQRVVWRVRVWDGAGRPSAWSAPALWEMGLLDPADWQARWIKPAGPPDTAMARPVAMLRGRFRLDGEVARARVYATARGLYALELNGRPVGDQVLAPGWTSYHHRIQYQTYDITDLLQRGENVLGAWLADGWYRGWLTWNGTRNHYGDQTALRVQVHVTYADGREAVFGTDETWRATKDGPYRMADLYDGEIYDARREMPGWSTPGFDDAAWAPVALFEGEPVALVAPQGPPMRRIEEIRPVSITRAPNGETVVDMGQNMVGWVRLRVRGPAGTEVVLRHAEVLDPEGNLYTDNLRSADQTDRYILRGEGEEVYEPRFTFHGFRYVGVRGYPGMLTADDLTGVVVHSDLPRTGWWTSSDSLLNQLYHNIIWGQKGNFVDVPTDCPQRDERLGWTGDAQVFAPTAALNMDVAGFFAKWLRDVALDQRPDGAVPHVVPNVLGPQAAGTAGWADAATVIPWEMYVAYGDAGLLEAQFPSMKAWVDYIGTQAGEDGIWRPGFQFGDWLAPLFDNTFAPYRATTGVDLIATAYYAHSADLVARTAGVLGRDEEARTYRALFERIREAFRHEFMTGAGRLSYETQTAYALALAFDLFPEAERAEAAARLAADVRARGNHLTTGFLGTPVLTRVLSDHGQLETAYALLTQTTYPSWLYPVTFGATTIWERWDAIRPDGTFQSPEMTSFNHYAYGAIGEWMYNVVAGLEADPARPGYRHLRVHPRPGGKLTHASARLMTPYGEAASAWSFHGPRFRLEVTVPPNTTARVVLPMAAGATVTEGDTPLRQAAGVHTVTTEGSDLHVEVGSGTYRFVYEAPELALFAAGYRELGPDATLSDVIAAAESVLAEVAPALLNPQVRQFGGSMPLRQARGTLLTPETYEALLEALARVNAERRAAILHTP
ncbi:glycoside hydrolase family 78 protein [Rhodocaloribacter litoris]|uniref:alpha-L-rhamnosidase n=1 Tax=Rhodocaloribacter litoris TaxID=2558931 RepID=UPI00141DF588|nr:alpha-L-rhamnosidase [Rhodocaloribacter litoris]QXD15384.1 glycoside hydrolase family 78 protein [Rhodocaloribacter litoris]